MSEIPSTLTEQQWQEIVEYKDKPNVMAPLWNHQKLLIKEVEFLRGLIGDLSQDGALEVYNRGKEAGIEESNRGRPVSLRTTYSQE